MKAIGIFIVAGLIFGLCWLVDQAFTKLFRSKAQHLSGLAVRAPKRYGIFGVILSVLGIMAITLAGQDRLLFYGGIAVLALGGALAVYYLGFGVFYNGDSFLYTRPLRKDREYSYSQIRSQKLYLIQGGSTVIELYLDDGSTVSLQSTMDGVYPFLDTAFAAWCLQTRRDPQSCSFHDPSQSLWFPTEEEC